MNEEFEKYNNEKKFHCDLQIGGLTFFNYTDSNYSNACFSPSEIFYDLKQDSCEDSIRKYSYRNFYEIRELVDKSVNIFLEKYELASNLTVSNFAIHTSSPVLGNALPLCCQTCTTIVIDSCGKPPRHRTCCALACNCCSR